MRHAKTALHPEGNDWLKAFYAVLLFLGFVMVFGGVLAVFGVGQ